KPSGGTWASLINAFAEGNLALLGGRVRGKGGSSKPRSSESGKKKLPAMHRAPDGAWALPMPVIDPAIVKRSSRAREEYGPNFSYGHYLRLGSLGKVGGLIGGLAGVFVLAKIPPTRKWLLGLRSSGTGPTAEERKNSFFQVTFVGEARGKRVVTRVSGGDFGYTETSKMLSESALLLATERAELPVKGGVVTPATAMGKRLIERLQEVGIAFDVIEG
ncbi:saccharopine dehydrogenase, partial [Endomicrobium sp. AH-315-J14]|nr:saccharopine dehydrogenase [Endomicrobium sp. AH-315-J14]